MLGATSVVATPLRLHQTVLRWAAVNLQWTKQCIMRGLRRTHAETTSVVATNAPGSWNLLLRCNQSAMELETVLSRGWSV
jgi:SH3-like domain-containing protein